ncbi:hypothetical protein B0T25DRAFT_514478 [Lasiosphaeria hispida]|uniref:Uncharacterized protein n=1 Tax=Lasiosphaeria hispida TaxID=260671 RepID=A0AAJ0HP88_9PEZI|nr:hypothetical protein B0T25DRAFT_514478 [Lasiosphaeria hispida]
MTHDPSQPGKPKRTRTYKFFNPKLRDNSYPLGDAYQEDLLEKSPRDTDEWKELAPREPKPYLAHVKRLGRAWPHLRSLADFMETGTVPQRWGQQPRKDAKPRPSSSPVAGTKTQSDVESGQIGEDDAEPTSEERARRTNVSRLDYSTTDEVESTSYTTPEALESGMKPEQGNRVKFRLYVVEDLSRDVIEILGSELKIDPSFFRSHIMDYAWYNVRDPYRDPPSLNLTARHRSWVQLRFVTARYYPTHEEFEEGFNKSQTFNVLRRPDDDENNQGFWDEQEAKIGVSRTRASLWVKPLTDGAGPGIGVLLLDPTIKTGKPLWGHFHNWEVPPQFGKPENEGHSKLRALNSFKDRFVYWAENNAAFPYPASDAAINSRLNPWGDAQAPMRVLLHMVCEEWLTISDYIKTRLNLIDWEISHPRLFLRDGGHIDVATQKLHVWRRWVPLYREMLSETLDRVFNAPLQTATTGGNEVIHNGSKSDWLPGSSGAPSINDYAHDYALLLSYMEEYQSRIDRLSTVATAFISIGDSRLSYDASKNVGRLTWLATIFIPLSFIASILSMQSDASQLENTVRLWAKVAFPMTAGMIVLVLAIRLFGTKTFQKFYRRHYRPILPSFKGAKADKRA